jgi:hypothetical protein
MTRKQQVEMVLSDAVAFWLPGEQALLCAPCLTGRRLQPITFWPLTDGHLGELCKLNQDFRACDQCLHEIGTLQRRAS